MSDNASRRAGRKPSLLLVAASPMYYQAPVYRALAESERLEFSAIFASSGGARPHDAGYGQPVTWDVDATSGYASTFLARHGRNPIDGPPYALRDVDVFKAVQARRPDVLWLHGYHT